jgi:hypothetical protein
MLFVFQNRVDALPARVRAVLGYSAEPGVEANTGSGGFWFVMSDTKFDSVRNRS